MPSTKPSYSEDEFFAKEEAEKIKRLVREKSQKLIVDEKDKLKQLHWMHCPKCGMDLHPVVIHGTTVDKCFECHGLFLDEAEFEKIAEGESSIVDTISRIFKNI